ncbi:MAG TPA: DUF3231 family protein [Pseudoneobacillus sp.]|nr:DUF3231 family protein [Pseudoneobacillus sp.]
MNHQTKLTSSEMGTIWVSIIEGTMAKCIFKYLVKTTKDEEIINLINKDLTFIQEFVQTLSDVFKQEGIPLPIGFTDKDVNESVPKLFSDGFILYYLQTMAKAGMSKGVTILSLITRKDLKTSYKKHLEHSYLMYESVEDVLLERGLYIRPPYIPIPQEVEFVNSNNYLGGIPIFSEKRPLNTIEISHLFMNMEVNTIGMMVCTAYSQVANDKDVAKYIIRGKEISKEIIKICSNALIESDVQAPAAWAIEVTESTVSPFSDKLMLSFINMLNTYGIGLYAISSATSLRTDLQAKYASMAKDVATYAKDGIELLIKNGWFEQPPTMPNREKLAKE